MPRWVVRPVAPEEIERHGLDESWSVLVDGTGGTPNAYHDMLDDAFDRAERLNADEESMGAVAVGEGV